MPAKQITEMYKSTGGDLGNAHENQNFHEVEIQSSQVTSRLYCRKIFGNIEGKSIHLNRIDADDLNSALAKDAAKNVINMDNFEITSEVHQRKPSNDEASQKNCVTTFEFQMPPYLANKGEITYDEDGDLILDRKKKDNLLIEHSISTNLKLVGLQVWRGALLLADYIISNPKLFENQNILELGSGVGLTSIVAGFLAKQVVCTDIDLEGILQLIQRNLDRNLDLIRAEIHVMKLDFLEKNLSANIEEKLNENTIILAADVIYDDDITEGFVDTLEMLFHSNPSRTAYIALEKRYVFTLADLDSVAPMYEQFFRLIKRKNLSWSIEHLPLDFPQYFQYNRVKQMVLMKIRKNI